MKNKHDYKILHVEDEPALQFVFQKQIDKLGYKIAALATDGPQAVEKAMNEPFDLIFMDVRLPELDGISATQLIREADNEINKRTTIIGMTAFAERTKCLQAGMNDFLQKPVLIDQLDTTLQKWLSEQAAQNIVDVRPQTFAETTDKLQEIEDKISKLRERFGLD